MKKKKQDNFNDIFYGILFAIVVGIMPLVVHIAVRPHSADVAFLGLGGTYHDPFNFMKAVFLTPVAGFMAFYAIAAPLTSGKSIDVKAWALKLPVLLSLVFLIFSLISAIFSSFPSTAWFGTSHREEGMMMWLVYFVVFWVAMMYVKSETQAKPILWALTFSSIVMGAIGLGQLFGYNFFGTDIGRWLVAGAEAHRVVLNFEIANGTLFNPNTFGKYTAMVMPVLLLAAIGYEGCGQKIIKAAMFIGGGLMLIGVFASSSLGGLIGVITATGVVIVTYLCSLIAKKGGKKLLWPGIALVVFGGAVALMLMFVPQLNHRFTTLTNRLQEAAAAETTDAQRFTFEGNRVIAHRGDETIFTLTVHNMNNSDWFTVHDANGAELTVTNFTRGIGETLDRYDINIPGFRILTLARGETMFTMEVARQAIPFMLVFENERLYGHPRTVSDYRIDFANPPASWGFEGRETWGSGRGFIWSRTFPLMPRYIILGSGPDTFVNVFPQHDLPALYLTFNNPYQIVDKAHNLFLQTWIGSGGISAIALFALFFHYIITTFWSLIKTKDESKFSYMLRFGLLAGVAAFVMSSMATDSTIGSTGVFFVLLGMGYGLNYALKKLPLSSR